MEHIKKFENTVAYDNLKYNLGIPNVCYIESENKLLINKQMHHIEVEAVATNKGVRLLDGPPISRGFEIDRIECDELSLIITNENINESDGLSISVPENKSYRFKIYFKAATNLAYLCATSSWVNVKILNVPNTVTSMANMFVTSSMPTFIKINANPNINSFANMFNGTFNSGATIEFVEDINPNADITNMLPTVAPVNNNFVLVVPIAYKDNYMNIINLAESRKWLVDYTLHL